MTVAELDDVIQRMGRVQEKIEHHAGPGCAWDATFPDGEKVRYELFGVKRPEIVKDEVVEMLQAIWSAKGWLSKFAVTRGGKRQDIDDVINNDPALQVCGDLVTWEKHAEQTWSQGNNFPVLGEVRYIFKFGYGVEKPSLNALTVTAGGYGFELNENTDIQMSVHQDSVTGPVIGDVFDFLKAAVIRWESVYTSLTK